MQDTGAGMRELVMCYSFSKATSEDDEPVLWLADCRVTRRWRWAAPILSGDLEETEDPPTNWSDLWPITR